MRKSFGEGHHHVPIVAEISRYDDDVSLVAVVVGQDVVCDHVCRSRADDDSARRWRAYKADPRQTGKPDETVVGADARSPLLNREYRQQRVGHPISMRTNLLTECHEDGTTLRSKNYRHCRQ